MELLKTEVLSEENIESFGKINKILWISCEKNSLMIKSQSKNYYQRNFTQEIGI